MHSGQLAFAKTQQVSQRRGELLATNYLVPQGTWCTGAPSSSTRNCKPGPHRPTSRRSSTGWASPRSRSR
eukprot:3311265-Alexandrium_andersonii.AAC.1